MILYLNRFSYNLTFGFLILCLFIYLSLTFLLSEPYVLLKSHNFFWKNYSEGNSTYISYSDNYILNISQKRINYLLNKLYEKEKNYSSTLNELNLISFELLNKKNESYFGEFNREINEYLKIKDNSVEVTDSFIQHLYNISGQYSSDRLIKNDNELKVILRKYI